MSKLEIILDILPQTQCGLCQHQGCKPYAQALINDQDSIEKCHPGGLETLHKLAKVLNKDPAPYLQEVSNRVLKNTVVKIDEATCIGCTKCIQVCPVDAIAGTAKANHLIITAECTGCNLCIPACPVDCIYEVPTSENTVASSYRRLRYEQRLQRLSNIKNDQQKTHKSNKDKIRAKLAEIRAKNEKR